VLDPYPSRDQPLDGHLNSIATDLLNAIPKGQALTRKGKEKELKALITSCLKQACYIAESLESPLEGPEVGHDAPPV